VQRERAAREAAVQGLEAELAKAEAETTAARRQLSVVEAKAAASAASAAAQASERGNEVGFYVSCMFLACTIARLLVSPGV